MARPTSSNSRPIAYGPGQYSRIEYVHFRLIGWALLKLTPRSIQSRPIRQMPPNRHRKLAFASTWYMHICLRRAASLCLRGLKLKRKETLLHRFRPEPVFRYLSERALWRKSHSRFAARCPQRSQLGCCKRRDLDNSDVINTASLVRLVHGGTPRLATVQYCRSLFGSGTGDCRVTLWNSDRHVWRSTGRYLLH